MAEELTATSGDEEYLATLPLERTWLSDIVEVFLASSRGINEIEGVLIALIKRTDRNLGKEGEATITRTINNYCVNSNDLARTSNHSLFKRIGPSQYKLLTYPFSPDLISIQKIRFSDHAYTNVWEFFNQKLAGNSKWLAMTKRERLVHFSKQLLENQKVKEMLRVYQGRDA